MSTLAENFRVPSDDEFGIDGLPYVTTTKEIFVTIRRSPAISRNSSSFPLPANRAAVYELATHTLPR
jgi:hypothetical protein